MKRPPTLIDRLYRSSFAKQTMPGWMSNQAMRERLVAARRFVLDDGMSSFLADLAVAGFKTPDGGLLSGRLSAKLVDQMRVSARSPHKLVWVEYNLRAETTRASELSGNSPINPKDVPSREGWLIEQHPGIESAFRMHLFNEVPQDEAETDGYGIEVYTFPFCFAWTADDTPLPWNLAIKGSNEGARSSSEVYTGVVGYHSGRIGVVHSDLIKNFIKHPKRNALIELLKEWTGLIRRVWALLATINDIPMTVGEVRQSKGFVARGAYRKFLDHSVITLSIPGKKDHQKVARSLIAQARRRAHQVRGHWRRDWHHPGSRQCLHHWDLTGHKCEMCGGQRMWIAEHVRGDASIGFVTHDYEVVHEENRKEGP